MKTTLRIFTTCIAIISAIADTPEETLQRLKSLLEKDLITQNDYEKQKEIILKQMNDAPPATPKEIVHFCVYNGDNLEIDKLFAGQLFSESADANGAVKEILDACGVAPSFVVRPENVPNAAAVIRGADRYVVYNPGFFSKMKGETKSNWSVYSILAHEIGHHFGGHTLQAGGSRPDLELEADQFSGHVLARMGATIEEAEMAMNLFGSEQDGPTHPGKRRRLDAIRKGWTAAKKQVPTKSQTTEVTPSIRLPAPGTSKNTPPGRRAVRPCVHRVACVHTTDCVHQTPCIHQGPCSHQSPCVHTGTCQHTIPCQHPFYTVYGVRAAHAFDVLHPYDQLHAFDLAHVSDQLHSFDLIHPDGDKLHEFDLEHPNGDPE